MSSNVWHFEDFELDPNAYRLSHSGEIVRLERIPLELLFLLIERCSQLVTREEILERIWGKGVFIDREHAINTAVRKIRRALNDDVNSPRFIVTIPGKGYRFAAPVIVANGGQTTNGKSENAINGESADFLAAPGVSDERQPHRHTYRRAGLLCVAVLTLVAGVIVAVRNRSVRLPVALESKLSGGVRYPNRPMTRR